MASPLGRDTGYSYGDYRRWDDGVRRELHGGRVVVMSPAPGPVHQSVLAALVVEIGLFLRGRDCRLFPAPFDVRLPEGDEPDDEVATVLQPDLSIVCDSSKIRQSGCHGAPDWVIEVLSPSTATFDHLRKRELYERHGVVEYWLVHPTDRLVTIYRRSAETVGRFGAAEIRGVEEPFGPSLFPELAIRWREVFGDLPAPGA
ncbi:MAG: Uma2 family endonuclease [Holophagales bacterium]|nr:Uma2 family endonuclease [Holophagales bacterium]